MSLSLDEVRHVAALARLSLSPDEERRFQNQLSAILDAVGQLSALDTEGVAPTSGGAPVETLAPAQRPDALAPCLDPEQALANAPARRGTSFAVPKVIE